MYDFNHNNGKRIFAKVLIISINNIVHFADNLTNCRTESASRFFLTDKSRRVFFFMHTFHGLFKKNTSLLEHNFEISLLCFCRSFKDGFLILSEIYLINA